MKSVGIGRILIALSIVFRTGTDSFHLPIKGSPRFPRIFVSTDEAAASELPTTKKSETTKTKAKKAKKRKKSKETDEIYYWKEESDPFTLNEHDLRMIVRGGPRPLRRHRTSRGFVYNPSAPYQSAFRQVALDALGMRADDPPLFENEHSLSIRVVFRMQRPKSHFVGSKPGQGRLREGSEILPRKTDVDNLAKFVLDSLQGIVYEDDKQVVALHLIKVWDSTDECRGATDIALRVIDDSAEEEFLNGTSTLF